MDDIRDTEPPFLQRWFTYTDACAASTMSGPRLRKWTTSGALDRFMPLREEGTWLRYSFADLVLLALAQSLLDLGISSRRAFAWADEAVRALRDREFDGSVLIYRETSGATAFRVIEATGASATDQLSNMELGVYINVREIALHAARRLVISRAIDPGKGTLSERLRASFERRVRKYRPPPAPSPTPKRIKRGTAAAS